MLHTDYTLLDIKSSSCSGDSRRTHKRTFYCISTGLSPTDNAGFTENQPLMVTPVKARIYIRGAGKNYSVEFSKRTNIQLRQIASILRLLGAP